MKFIDFFSKSAILIFILIVILFGIREKKNIFSLFLNGVIEGQKMVIELFPTLLALIVAVGMLNSSGVINIISKLIAPILNFFNISEVLAPLIILRPISGSTTTAIATTIMSEYGTDSSIGLITSCIMGSTETTIYVASIYSSKVKVKDIKSVIIIGLLGDFVGILASVTAYNIGIM